MKKFIGILLETAPLILTIFVFDLIEKEIDSFVLRILLVAASAIVAIILRYALEAILLRKPDAIAFFRKPDYRTYLTVVVGGLILGVLIVLVYWFFDLEITP